MGVRVVRRILASSRYFIILAVLGAFLASVVVLCFGALLAVDIAIDAVLEERVNEEAAKHLSLRSIEVIDLFLLGTVLYIISLGLYSLFIDRQLTMPGWLHIATLDDLKERLLGVVSVLLGVTFLGNVLEWENSRDILYLGAAIALVVLALSVYTVVSTYVHRMNDERRHALEAELARREQLNTSPPTSSDSP
jgi:uncharacterized membrane protein YqhA